MGALKSRTLAELLLDRVTASSSAVAFKTPAPGGWKDHSWKDVGQRVERIACGLLSLGLQPEERSAILASTRLDWILADLGILCAGGATSTIYPSNTPEECAYILGDSASRICFVENAEQQAKIEQVRGQLPGLLKVVVFDPGSAGSTDFVISLAQLEELGQKWSAEHPGEYEKTARAVRPDQLATLIYTSGTTGQPKGVELTHDSWIFEGEAIDALGILTADDVQLLWLPLAHSFGKVLTAATLMVGVPTAVDGRVDKVVDNLASIRPTFVAAVPRIFEKVYNKVISGVKEAGGLKLSLFRWAVGVGKQASALRQKKQPVGGLLSLKFSIADKLVFSKIKAKFGGRLRYFISGSAPLSRDIGEFFDAAGITILEGYGLTESSAASFVNRPDQFRVGTVGPPLPGVEIKIMPEDGEILLKGRGIMRGYHNRPEDTAAALTPDGWLRTGDIGVLEDGLLKITDRKKDLIKTSGGKYVAPQFLEGKLKSASPLISQVVVHGDQRNFCSALVTLSEEELKKWASANGKEGKSYAELSADPAVKALVQPIIDELNKTLPSYETIKRFALLPADFSIETGELTPSLKVKRKVVEARFKELLDGFYKGSLESV